MDAIGFYIKSLPASMAHFNRDQVYLFPIEKNKGGYGKIRIPTVMVPKLKMLIAPGAQVRRGCTNSRQGLFRLLLPANRT